MNHSQLEENIIDANNSKLKYISLFASGFSIFVLSTDFLARGVWHVEYLYLYKMLDIIFSIISSMALIYFWLLKIKNITFKKAGTIAFPFIFLIWSAIITGVDFSMLGFSTFIIVALSITFFLYLNLLVSIIYFLSSCMALITTLYFRGQLFENFLPVLFLVIPTISISVLIIAQNYKNKLRDLLNQETMAEMNQKLRDSNENLENEVEKRTKEILIALKKAEESDRLKSAFLANMSHEIRTPMNGILGFAELLKEPNLTGAEQQKYIRIIEKSGARMLSTINDIVDISIIESGKIKVYISETNIIEKFESIYYFFKPEVERKGLQFFNRNQLTLKDSIISTDYEKIFAVFSNLVKNAIKFTNKGSIEFGCIKLDSFLEFYVKDTGIGIRNEMQVVIFERFRQEEEGFSRGYEGSGLGLAISKAYVESLGGEIWVDSEFGKGSTFYFTIPCNSNKEENEDIENVSSTNVDENNVKNLKILIVEDDETSELLISIAIQKFSKEILNARTGIEAIEYCRVNPDLDLIFMDIRMPDMNGYDATKQIRKFNNDVVIIAQTAYAEAEHREKSLAAGCNDYISKPIDCLLLRGLINKYFNKLETEI